MLPPTAPEVPAAPEVAPGIAKALLTVPEAAQLLSLGRTTVYGLIRSSRLPVVKIGGCTRVPVEGPVEWVRGLERA